MARIPAQLRATIAKNIRECRQKKFPGRGGAKKCAEAFGVTPQQWSPWENGTRTPDEVRLKEIALFLGVTVEYLRTDRSPPQSAPLPINIEASLPPVASSLGMHELLALLENSYRLMCVVTTLQNEALLGRRRCLPVIDLMRQMRVYLEYKLRE